MGVIEDSIVGETSYYGWERERRKPLGLRVPPGYWFSTAIGEVPISSMKLEHLKKALKYATRRRWVNKAIELRAEIKRREDTNERVL